MDQLNTNEQGACILLPITATKSGPLRTIGINVNEANGNFRTAIYSDNGGVPNLLISQSGPIVPLRSTNVGGYGWNDVPVPGVNVVAGTKYWIGYQYDNPAFLPWGDFGPVTFYYFNQAFGPYPANASGYSAAINENRNNMRMIY